MPISYYLMAMTLGCVVFVGCRLGIEDTDLQYLQLAQDSFDAQAQRVSIEDAINPVFESMEGPHPVDEYVRIGLLQNSEIQETRHLVASLANRVPQAATLPDPILGLTAFPSPVQTAAGEQEFALSVNQKFPWQGKLATRAAIAEEDVNAARATLAAVELKVAEQIKHAYAQLNFFQQALAIIARDKKQLELIKTIVEQMYRVKPEVSQQDLLQVQVALSRIDAEISQFQQQKKSSQAKLARLLHVSPETNLEALENSTMDALEYDIDQIYEFAIQSRPELHAQLASIQRNRQATLLAELNDYPDMTFGFNWISTDSSGISPVSNGDDALMVTLGMNMPMYRKGKDAGVREARARALSSAKKYDRLRDETMEGVADLFAKMKSLEEMLRLFRREIIPKQELTLEQSVSDYQVGKIDFLQMIENWRHLLRFHIQEKRLIADLEKIMASLARQMGEFDIPSNVGAEPAAESSKIDHEQMDQ